MKKKKNITTIWRPGFNCRVLGTCVELLVKQVNAKGKLECFNCKTGVFVRLFTPMSTKRKQLQSTFLGKSHLLYREYLTIIKKN